MAVRFLEDLNVDSTIVLSGTAPTLRIQDSRNLNNPDWDNVSLGNIEFYSSDTTSPGARVLSEIEAFSNGSAASGPNSELRFKTSAIADSSPQIRLTISHDGTSTFAGNVTAGSNSLTAGSLDINGNADISGTATIDSQITTNYGVKFTGGATDFLLYNNAGENVIYMRDTTNGAMITSWHTDKFEVDKNLDAKDGVDVTGNITVTGTVDGVDIAARDAVLTSTTTTANAALPKAGGTMTGNLTINSTYPRIFLTDSNNNDDWSIINNDGKFGIYNDTDTSYALTVDGSNNVGIGTSSPGQKLHVNGNIRVGNSTDAFYGNRFTALSNADVELRSNNGYDLILNANSGDNVGIGTTSPAKKLDVNGDTNITGYLDLKVSSPTGSPLLRFYQSTTRRGFIQMADTNNNLRVASEYGSVSLEAASSEGTDSDTSYIRIKPGGTVEIGAVDGDATISTDGSMTFKIDADNDETSQKFSFVNNAGTEVASIDESGNLTLNGGIQASLPTSPGATGTLFNDRGTVRVS